MKFFSKFFNNIKYKSSLNFLLNFFFIKQMLSVNINHILYPHLFLPFKNLKIKIIKNTKNKKIIFIFLIIIIFLLNISVITYIL